MENRINLLKVEVVYLKDEDDLKVEMKMTEMMKELIDDSGTENNVGEAMMIVSKILNDMLDKINENLNEGEEK